MMDATRFEIAETCFGRLKAIEITNKHTREQLVILPDMGGMLLGYRLLVNHQLISILENYRTETELLETIGNSFKGCLLFPFPNRIDGGKYQFKGKQYQLNVNFSNENNAIHGLLFDKKFVKISQTIDEHHCSLVLSHSDKNLPGYPFAFQIDIAYTLNEQSELSICTRITNTGNQNLPAGIGWHPYFTLGCQIDHLRISFPAAEKYITNQRMLPTGEHDAYNDFSNLKQIGNNRFDTCFKVAANSGQAETILYNSNLKGGIKVWQNTGHNQYNYLQLYTPDHRQSIAIEPMTCLPNAFNINSEFLDLPPGSIHEVEWGIKKHCQ
ncbi:MAG: aldose 1-epimerase [Bacteroidota bacterium]|nr:MAG: aldose 1-epimerase [Bacteroidota bacterium]